MAAKDILDPNPFANPSFAEKGNKAAREIYTAMGFALDRWEHCDMSFATVYAALVCPERSNHMLMRAFGTITAPTTKQAMTWEACDAFFGSHENQDLHKQCRHLLNLYQTAAARRNEIAHAVVMRDMIPDVVTDWFLFPPIFATRKNKIFHDGPKYRYSTNEINHFAKCFAEMAARARSLSQSIREFYWSLQETRG